MSKELEAWKTIKDIGLTHMTYDSDENLDGEWEYDAVEVDDGTVEDNFPDECKLIEQSLLKYEKLCKVINQLTDMVCIHKIYMTKSAQETLCRNSLELINNRYEVKEDEED